MKAFSKDLRQQMLVPFMLLAILLVALLLRVFQLDAESLWLDEVYSVNWGNHDFVQILGLSIQNRHPPLYLLLLHYWMQLFGDSEFSVRLPSVLFGVFSVAMLYKVGTLLFNKWTGLMSAFIMAISAYQIYYSQEARAYMMMVLFALISFYFFLKLFEGKNYWILAGYVLFSTTLMYAHYYGLFLVFVQALFVLGFYALRRHPNNATTVTTTFGTWGLAAGATVILYLPGFFYLAYTLIHPNPPVYGQTPPGLSDVSKSLLQYAGAPYWGAPSSPSLLLLAILTLFALIAVFVLLKRGGERMKLSLLLLWLIVPVALPFLLSQISNLQYAGRYSIAALPALYLLVAVGMQRVGSVAMRASTRSTTFVALAGLAVTAGLFAVTGILYVSILHDYFTSVKKEQWRDIARDVKTYAEPGDAVVISQGFMATPYNYYTRGNELPDTVIPLHPKKVNDVGYEVRGSNRVWLLLSHIRTEEQKEQFKANLEGERFKVAEHKRYGEIDLTLYEKE